MNRYINVLFRILYREDDSFIDCFYLICISKISSDRSNDAAARRRRYQRQNSLTDLHEAVLKNCEKSARFAIASGVPIDQTDHTEKTALYYACEQGYSKIVKILLAYGARHDVIDLNQTSSLWIAARQGHHEIVLILLNQGAKPDLISLDNTTPLYQASYEGHEKCVRHLLSYGASVHIAKNSGATPLFVASRNGYYRIVKRLLNCGANPAVAQVDLRSPLHTALLYNQAKCARLLLRNNIACLAQDTDIYGCTHLHFLAKKSNMKCTRVYFHHLKTNRISIDLNKKDTFGNTALHIATFSEKIKFARYLINKGCDINQSNCFGWTHEKYLLENQEKFQIDEPLPKVYLHKLLFKYLINPTEEVKSIQEEVESYVQQLVSYVEKQNPLFRNTIIHSGSYYEGTRVGLPDEFDYMINLTEIEHLCEFVENPFDPPGYGRLYPENTLEAFEKLSPYLEPITRCISSEKIRKRFYQLLTSGRAHVMCKDISSKFKHLKFEWASGDKRCGTTIHAEWYGKQYPCLSINIDVVPCLTIHTWPHSATIKCPLLKDQFHVITRSSEADQTHLWRISTSQAELNYFQSLSLEKKNVYLCLKILRYSQPYNREINKVKYNNEEIAPSYMFKTEFLHETNRYPQSNYWTEGSSIHRVLSILKRLYKHLLIGSIKSFYIKNYNIIDSDDYKRLRPFQKEYIQILRSRLKEKLTVLNKKSIRRHTFVATERITEKCMLQQRAYTTEK